MSIVLRTKNLTSGKISYYLDVHANGKRFYEFLDIQADADDAEARAQAEDMMRKRLTELEEYPENFAQTFKRRSNFVAYFEKHAQEKPKTEKAWRNTLKYLKQFSSQISFAGIDEEWLEKFKAFLLERVSPNTAHTYFSKIKAALRKAVKEGILSLDPAAHVPNIKKNQPERVFLSEDELARLQRTPCKNENVRLAFLFACFTGLNLQSLETLTWKNIKKSSHDYCFIELGQKIPSGIDSLPVTLEAEQVLNQVSKANGIVEALSRSDEPIFLLPSRTEIQNCLNSWAKEASLEKRISFQVSRHTYAIRSLSNEMDLYTLSKFLGHKTIGVTKIYQDMLPAKSAE
ncbi:integrase family protein [Chloroherpeton thalassium ATCC 35110]|uniref:Integrase family protein n=1 Tax=Chloroherpeton thalassium (strain ATCC 35110 / GB-78) TaxID=517418 RepID=B3QW06_CHLT3|nr:site-specific integrase [Chloroherpeton thalassium]ACF14660.1 integrase family protein [Chloroherpeton thalassium ATCC 35110]